MVIDERYRYFATISLEKDPDAAITIELFADKAPITVNNFVHLSQSRFYDGLAFDRVVSGYLVEIGEHPGGSSYEVRDEFHPKLRHDTPGVVAMAEIGEPNGTSDGSQFYITLGAFPHLDAFELDGQFKDCENQDVKCHTVFGRVIDGMRYVNAFVEGSHTSAIRKGDAIRTIEINRERSTAPVVPPTPVTVLPPDCSNGIVVPSPLNNAGLVKDCQTLLRVRDQLAGDVNLNWSDSVPIRGWPGVIVEESRSRVVGLHLGFMGLNGIIPSDLSRLDALIDLNLTDNQLMGVVPRELGELAKLRYLKLSVNNLEGGIPTELGKLPELRVLDFGQNQLTGEIPEELGNLAKMEKIVLGANSLFGEIPPELTALTNLDHFVIDLNRFHGCVPVELRVKIHNVGNLGFCDDAVPVSPSKPLFEGGVDFVVTSIERLPRFQRHKIAYFIGSTDCPYPYETSIGILNCQEQEGVKRWPDPGETVELISHVWNAGDQGSGPFEYEWRLDGETVAVGSHSGLASDETVQFELDVNWPDDVSNPVYSFVVDPDDQIEELLEDNNAVNDWIKGYTLGIYFSLGAYESLMLSNKPGGTIQSPEFWIRDNVELLNELLAEAGLRDRIRVEQFHVSHERIPPSDIYWYLDGWWGIWDDFSIYTVEGHESRPEFDNGLLHEWMHQLGVIDLYVMHMGPRDVLLPDLNNPSQSAGCAMAYEERHDRCFRFPEDVEDLMSDLYPKVGAHTVGALASNSGHRRGHYGGYLYDTPHMTTVGVVDIDGVPVPGATLHFYQQEPGETRRIVDSIPEFTVITDHSGRAVLPNRGVTGPVTESGHQLRPNPFGVIDVVGYNSIFLIELVGECTDYDWLTIVEVNLAYWEGHTNESVFRRTLQFPLR